MRRNSLSHGTGSFAPRRLRAGNVASSSAVSGGAAGTSRKYHIQTATHIKLTTARIMNDPRHDTSAIKAAISGGVMALPIRAAEWVMPWANPQLRSGIHTVMARVAVGNVAPSPTPSARRAANRLASPPTTPVAAVATHTMRAQTHSVKRGPNLSPKYPPISWNSAYG